MSIKGANIAQKQLVVSAMGIKNNNGQVVKGDQVSVFPTEDHVWNLLQELGINLIQVASDQGINNLWINPNSCTYWKENMEAFLAYAEARGVKIVWHWCGTGDPNFGGSYGLLPPYNNNVRLWYATGVDLQARINRDFATLEKIGQAGFLGDSRIAWWCVINEAPYDNGSFAYVRDWIKAMLEKVQSYGGKTSAVGHSGNQGYAKTIGYNWDTFGTLLDKVQGHDYIHDVVRANQGLSPEAFYDVCKAEFDSIFAAVKSLKKGYDLDQFIEGELNCGNGTWNSVGFGTITLTQAQQSAYIKALFDSVTESGIGGFCWHEPVQQIQSVRQFGFIEYNGTPNTQSFETFKTGYIPPPPTECEEGYHKDPDTGECVPDEPPVVEAGFPYFLLLLIAMLVVLGLVSTSIFKESD